MGPYKVPLPLTATTEAMAKEDAPRKEILYEGYYYDVTDFIQRHPGGIELLEYYTEPGEDATIPILTFHHRSHAKVQGIMKSLKRRPADDTARTERQKLLTEDFLQLFKELQDEGYFKPDYVHVTWRLCEVLLFLLPGYYAAFNWSGNILGQLVALVLIGLGHGRAGFIMHELGHTASTGNKTVDYFIGRILIGLGWGMSFSWWTLYHSPHHAMPQRLHRDRAVEPFEFMITNVKSVEEKPEPGRRLVMKTQLYHLFLDTFAGLFVMQWQSATVVWETKNIFEAILIGIHYVVASYLGLWMFLATRLLWSAYSYGQVALSHAHLPVAEEPAHWVEYALV